MIIIKPKPVQENIPATIGIGLQMTILSMVMVSELQAVVLDFKSTEYPWYIKVPYDVYIAK